MTHSTNLKWLAERTVLFVKHGSHAYGTNVEGSDEDFKGVCIPPYNYYFGFLNKFEQAESKAPDTVIYELRKFFKLAAGCNPGILEVLYCDDSDVLAASHVGQRLRACRDQFLSQKALGTFTGYAASQMKRIRSQRLQSLHGEGSINRSIPRNPVRLELEEKYGYDTKHAMHLVRLTRMCKEIFETGKVNVKRPDAEELISIRNGAWTFGQLEEWAETETQALRVAAQTSSLPADCDHAELDRLCINMIMGFY